jgi:hypothetical protein
MPAKPRWFCDIENIIAKARALPGPLLERAHLEHLLGVSRRRSQQILEQCATGTVGASSVTTADALAAWLRERASGEARQYEHRRRHKVATVLAGLHSDWTRQQRLLVEAPVAIVTQRLEGLPEGVTLAPGEVNIRFSTAEEGLGKLLALAMALSNDLEAFERQTAVSPAEPGGVQLPQP